MLALGRALARRPKLLLLDELVLGLAPRDRREPAAGRPPVRAGLRLRRATRRAARPPRARGCRPWLRAFARRDRPAEQGRRAPRRPAALVASYLGEQAQATAASRRWLPPSRRADDGDVGKRTCGADTLRRAYDALSFRSSSENALRTERERRVVPENIEALAEAGVFRLTLPRSLRRIRGVGGHTGRGAGGDRAGLRLDLVGRLGLQRRHLARCALPGRGPGRGLRDARVPVSAVATPTAVARPVAGGYRVTGRWAFNTGCLDAHWAFLGAMQEGVDDSAGHMVVLVPYSELEIHDDWYVSGLVGTGSCTVSADDVLVPARTVFSTWTRGSAPRRWRHGAEPKRRASALPHPEGAVHRREQPRRAARTGQGRDGRIHGATAGRGRSLHAVPGPERGAVHASPGRRGGDDSSTRRSFHTRRCAELVDRKALADEPYTVEERALVRMDLGWVTRARARGDADFCRRRAARRRSTRTCRSSASPETSRRSRCTAYSTRPRTSSCSAACSAGSSRTPSCCEPHSEAMP